MFIFLIVLLVAYLLIGLLAMVYTEWMTDERKLKLILIWPKVMFFG